MDLNTYVRTLAFENFDSEIKWLIRKAIMNQQPENFKDDEVIKPGEFLDKNDGRLDDVISDCFCDRCDIDYEEMHLPNAFKVLNIFDLEKIEKYFEYFLDKSDAPLCMKLIFAQGTDSKGKKRYAKYPLITAMFSLWNELFVSFAEIENK